MRGLILRALIFVAAGGALLFAAARGGRVAGHLGPFGKTDGAGILDDTGGTIVQVLTYFNLETSPATTPIYQQVFEVLPPSIDCLVACDSKAAVEKFLESFAAAGTAGGRRLQLVNVEHPISCWARDALIPRQNRSTWQPAAAFVPARSEGIWTQKWLNEIGFGKRLQQLRLIPGIVESGLAIEGGNVVANAQRAFVGVNHIPLGLWSGEREKWYGPLEQLFGRDFVILHDEAGGVPWDHVDMYFMPLDDQTVVVGNAAEGPFDLWQSCNSIAGACAQLGYRVARVPVKLFESGVPGNTYPVLLTYTNVLIEQRDGRRRLYMPVYGEEALDAAAESTYRELGFDVRTVSFRPLLALNGGIRCFVNVLRRSPQIVPHPLPAAGASTITIFHRDGSVQHVPVPENQKDQATSPPRT